MSAPVFIADPSALRAGERVVLDGDEGRHAAVVRRIGVGEEVELTDGAGHLARCVVAAAGRDGLVCDVISRMDVPAAQPRLVVAQAIPKGDRGETAVETLTEVGVDEILPWAAARCVTRWKGERGEKSLRKWRSTAREAAKQSRRAWVPDVTDQVTTRQLVERARGAQLCVVLHEEADQALGQVRVPEAGDVLVIVGPEGGLAPDELVALGGAGGVVTRLGPSVLRTSTAGTVAAGVLLAATSRWS